MACSIEITHVSGVGLGPGGKPNTILVRGTSVDCAVDLDTGQSVIVGVSCDSPAGPFVEAPAKVDAEGNWEATISTPAGCQCGQGVFVIARCATNSACTASTNRSQLLCRTCPSAGSNEPELSPVVTCRPDGTASVLVQARVVNNTPDPIVARMICGPGGTPQVGGSTSVAPGQTRKLTGTCTYPTPFTPQPFVQFVDPITGELLDCPVVPRPVFPLEPCPRDCPQVENLRAEVTGCAGGGQTATVQFNANLSPPTPGCIFLWEFDDGSNTAFTSTPEVSHAYENPGTYAASVTALCDRCADTDTQVVVVPRCGDAGNGGETSGCFFLRVAGVIAAIIAALALYAGLCLPVSPVLKKILLVTAGVSAASSAVLLALWANFCKKPCGASLLIMWQIALGTGIGAFYFAKCCPILNGVGAFLLIFASATALAWQRRCDIGFCRFNEELAVVISVIIVPVIAWIGGLGIAAICLNPVVGAVVGLLSSEVAIALLRCRKVAPT
jgi:hypothetical protein